MPGMVCIHAFWNEATTKYPQENSLARGEAEVKP